MNFMEDLENFLKNPTTTTTTTTWKNMIPRLLHAVKKKKKKGKKVGENSQRNPLKNLKY